MLRPELLDDRFDHQLGPGDGSPEVGARGDRGQRRADPVAFQAAQRTHPLQVGTHVRQRGAQPLLAQVVEPDLVSRQGKFLGNAVSHQPCAQDRDALDLRVIHGDLRPSRAFSQRVR